MANKYEQRQFLQIFATGKNGIEFEVDDLYWFEENGVHEFSSGQGHVENYTFRFVITDYAIISNPTVLNLLD